MAQRTSGIGRRADGKYYAWQLLSLRESREYEADYQKKLSEQAEKEKYKSGFHRLDLIKEGVNMSDKTGRPSMGEWAMREGEFQDITDSITDLYLLRPNIRSSELMKYMQDNFPKTMSHIKTKYASNLERNMRAVPEWDAVMRVAYRLHKNDLLELQIRKGLDEGVTYTDDNGIQRTLIAMTPTERLETMKYLDELEEKENGSKGGNSSTDRTLANIENALSEFGGDDPDAS